MGGLSLITVLTIKSNDIDVSSYPSDDKHGFILSRLENGYKYREVVTSQPIFETSEEAITKGNKLVESIKSLKLDE